MPTQSLSRRVLVKVAIKLYEANKYCLTISGRDDNSPYIVATEIEPGWKVPDDFIVGLNQLRKYIPSLKKFTHSGDTIPRIDLTVDQKEFGNDLIVFIRKSQELKKLKAELTKYRYKTDKEFKDIIRRNINLQFKDRPQSFNLSHSTFHGREILEIDSGSGVVL